ncbi:tyrosine-type recombinase/integrase [Nocardia sp. NPDC004711]
MKRTGKSQAAAEAALKAALTERSAIAGGANEGLKPTTRLSEAITLWLDHAEAEGKRRPQTLDQYRAAAKVVCAPHTGIGGLQLRELKTATVSGFLRRVAKEHPAQARLARVTIVGACSLAVDHDALPHNPARDAFTPAAKVKEVTIIESEERQALRARLRAWAAGEVAPGESPRQSGGQPRTQTLVDLMDLMLATGCRIGELLAVRWGDVNLDSTPPRLTVCGTVVQTSDGLVRQDLTKTESGYRSLAVPDFAVEILKRLKPKKRPAADSPVIASQTGGWRGPNNLNRQWREARGPEFDWVTWHIFRKTVLTAVDEKHGLDAAQAQGGHSNRTTVTRRHYVKRAIEAPDVRDALEPLGDREISVTSS